MNSNHTKGHTPGPWQVHETCHQMNFEDSTICEIRYHGQKESFFIGSPATNHGTALADATLIAAAPEMLAALQRFQDEWVVNGNPAQRANNYSIEKQIYAAIEKATVDNLKFTE